MVEMIMLSAILVTVLLILNAFLNHVFGYGSPDEYGKVLEGALTIAILYLVIIAMLGNNLMPSGIPFVDKMENYSSLTDMFKNDLSAFVMECAELISLTFIISLISELIPSTFGGEGITGKIIRSIVLVFIGVVANNYFLSLVGKTAAFSWAITALQCFFSGAALLVTPAMLIGEMLKLSPDSQVVSFFIKKLPETKIGKAMSTAASNSVFLVIVVMIFESQYGSMVSLVSQIPALIALFAPIVLMIIGIKLMLKSVTK